MVRLPSVTTDGALLLPSTIAKGYEVRLESDSFNRTQFAVVIP